MWSRQGVRLTIEAEFATVLQGLRGCGIEWLDCEALQRRHGLGRGSLFIFDGLVAGDYRERKRALMALAGRVLAVGAEPLVNALYVVPGITGDPLALYHDLRAANARLGCEFYEGVVAKQADSLYPFQLASPELPFPAWVKHRFSPGSFERRFDRLDATLDACRV